jgi:hypothetical protein
LTKAQRFSNQSISISLTFQFSLKDYTFSNCSIFLAEKIEKKEAGEKPERKRSGKVNDLVKRM